MNTIAFQPEFRPALPVIFGAIDYRESRTAIEKIDRILTAVDLAHCMLAQKTQLLKTSKP